MSRSRLGAVLAAALFLVAACAAAPAVPSASPAPPPTSTALTPTPAPTALATVTPTIEPTASPAPTAVALAKIQPVVGTVLPIAARDGAPGLVSCSGLGPFPFQVLSGPFGAERLAGPEYDVLRQTIARYGDDPEFGFDHATFTVAFRDDTTVVFIGDIRRPEAFYADVEVKRGAAGWAWAGMGGGCVVLGAPGAGWDEAMWRLDPSFKKPTTTSQKVHLLVHEVKCAAGVPVAGRLSPAWVFLEQDRVRIHLFVRSVKPQGSCKGIDPTPVTIVLPEPLGPRLLVDAVNHDICEGCGG
jgi:hypothetical protein